MSILRVARRTVLGAALALLPLALQAPGALAYEEWCSDDPVVHVQVDGRPVSVNVTVSVPVDRRGLLHTATAGGSVQGHTVVVDVAGPDSPFKVEARIRRLGRSAGDPSAVYQPGQHVTLTFDGVNP